MGVDPHPGMRKPLRLDDLYASPPPWDIGRPQPALLDLTAAVRGRVLDIGCGTGEHALLAAALGCEATGIDLAATALGVARRKARDRGLAARFLQHDALRLAEFGETFDTVLDCGLFHLFTGADRTALVDGLRVALAPAGRYLMLGFSDRQPGGPGPHRLTRHEITAAFTDDWHLDSLTAATIETTTDPAGVPAWLAMITRNGAR